MVWCCRRLIRGRFCVVLIIVVAGFALISLDMQYTHYLLQYKTGSHSPAHKKEVLTMRRRLTFNNATTELVLPGTTDISYAETTFHRYMMQTEVICPNAKRLGNSLDGGWDVCLFGLFNITQPCLVYSFGINFDWSFDDAIVNEFNCTVRAFDPSMAVPEHVRGKNIWFYKQGIGGKDFVNEKGWQMRTLESFIHLFNETKETIDYLKVDVEYSEWSALEAILNSTVLSKVKQLGLEVHTKELYGWPQSRSTVNDLIYYSDILSRLQSAGFYRWYWHFNHFGRFFSWAGQRSLTCCYEFVFVNVDYYPI